MPEETLPRLITARDMCRQVGIATQTAAVWRLRGFGPRFIKVGSRVMYETSEVSRWLVSRGRKSTSDLGVENP